MAVIAVGLFVFPGWVKAVFGGQWHFFGVVFLLLIGLMMLVARFRPRSTPWVHEDSGEVNLKPWKYVIPCGIALLLVVICIYAFFADFSVLGEAAAVVPED
ncbi:hypothetical protein SDC9_138084 [bioreactor metagenome]|uniref:Uncharacterized protein n=1 Tax=bioreactor metagenome TaxID=1076179 RepID=A0A645DNW1_9ZZZZ